ncbi:MAG: hypothetical protein F4Y08_06300 [Caldilineaceae bacterium SB0662_bin_9]|uniref:PepSY domain-containing protein n=1 Tax=Caldilineaceae bacterium SB0662_bin_9 TaxID=2605258 RepID=A0A6B1DRT7_9CHLR|nr:hypothetical protein [Caldilineaceae bacterium]MYD89937.1 hypothetical protein [Caldilineaceae bacterium SB0662_bin_9]
MDGLQAVVTAKKQALKYFSDEGIRRLGLEELRYDENKNRWHVTLSFDLFLEDMDIFEAQPRKTKNIIVNDEDGELIAIEDGTLK